MRSYYRLRRNPGKYHSQRRKWLVLFFIFVNLSAFGQKEFYKNDSPFKKKISDSTKVLEEIRISRDIHRKNPEEGKEFTHAKKAIDLALEMEDTLLYARALDNLGLLYRFRHQYAQAASLHSRAFELIRNMDVDPIHKMIFANNAGVASRYYEKYDMAVLYYLAALKIAEKENNLKNIAISCNGLGNALINIEGRQQEALSYFNRALEIEQKRNNSRGIAMNYLSISDYYIQKDQFEIARKFLSKLKQLNQSSNDDHGIAITDEFLGISYLKEGKDYGKAMTYLKLALEGFRKINDIPKQGEILSNLAKVSEKQNRTDQSLAYYSESMDLAKSTNSKGLVFENAKNLANIYEEKNDLKNALKYLKIAQSYKDSIDLSEQEIQITALTTKYDIDKKEAHIELLENEKQLRKQQLLSQQEKIKRQQILFMLIGVLVLAILVIVILQNRAARQKKRSDSLLAKREKERFQAIYERDVAQAEMLASRMQMNPHFLFNCLNSINYLIQKEENEKATKYLIVFSRFVRMVLENSRSQVVPLQEELMLIRHYLTLEENRFDHDFGYNISVNDEARMKDVMIPPLLLQPFVENSILHGLLPSKKEKKHIDLIVNFENNHVEITIEDNGVGRTREKIYQPANGHKSLGTKITGERIDLFNKIYQSDITCKTEDIMDENGVIDGTRVIIILTPGYKLVADKESKIKI